MAEGDQPARSAKAEKVTWIDKATLGIAALTLVTTTGLGILTFMVDRRVKAVEASAAEFQAAGTLEYSYSVVALGNYCNSTKDLSQFESDHISPLNIYDNYVQNDIWRAAEKRLTSEDCGRLFPGPEDDPHAPNPLDNLSLAYITIGKQGSFNPRVTLKVSKVGKVDAVKPIWSYQRAGGREEDIPLGVVRESKAAQFPVAILRDGVPISPSIYIPFEAAWTSPVTNEPYKLPLDFIFDRNHWQSISTGVQRSGA